ncbi:MAG: fructose-bisphosphate aldolase [Candidatus Aenigmarchaeota archaeon]|nr:fructose-bisphosphate aldolase [Candidatus Aenigmarchaeota archaeon]
MFNKKQKRLNKIIDPKTKKILLMAFDHAVEHGPVVYEGINLDPLRIAKIAHEGGANALIVHSGAAKYIRKYLKKLPLIVKLNGRTDLTTKKIQSIVTTVKEAEYVGATAVAYTVYVGSEYEDKMLENLSQVKKQCLEKGMPLIGFMYPRVEGKNKDDPRLVRYAARLGAELGVDIVKTYYTESKETFSKVIKDANFVPVVSAGGSVRESDVEFFQMVKDVMDSGAAGMTIGRNIWERGNGSTILKEIKRIIHGG